MRLKIPLQIHFSVSDGRVVRLDGFTQVVNAHSCLLAMANRVEVGKRVTLLNLGSGGSNPAPSLGPRERVRGALPPH